MIRNVRSTFPTYKDMSRKICLNDLRFMDVALAMAYSRLGATSPNPSVGCVIVKSGRVIAKAATSKGGRPHAETQALALAGNKAAGSSIYVTLEPCSHHGSTPPCTEAIIAANPKEVIIACEDPFPLVSGRGIAWLKSEGILVVHGVRENKAKVLNRGFFNRIRFGEPILVKDSRTSLYDGEFVLKPGQSKKEALKEAGDKGFTRLFYT